MDNDTSRYEYIPLLSPCAVAALPFAAAEAVHAAAVITPGICVKGLCNGRYPHPDTLCFVDRAPDEAQRRQLRELIVIAPPALAAVLECRALLVCDDPRTVFIDLIAALQARHQLSPFSSLVGNPVAEPRIDPTAQVHLKAVIEDDVMIGSGCQVGAGCVIKQGTVLRKDVIVRENTVIGCDGIARHVAHDGRVLRFPHVAGVIVGEGAEIGANCVIARGALTSTCIGAASIVGNLCNIGHGVQLGIKTWMSVGCLIGGNSRLGEGVTLGLGVQVRDNLQLGAGASVAMGSVVMRSVAAGASVLGNPAKVVPGVVAGPDR